VWLVEVGGSIVLFNVDGDVSITHCVGSIHPFHVFDLTTKDGLDDVVKGGDEGDLVGVCYFDGSINCHCSIGLLFYWFVVWLAYRLSAMATMMVVTVKINPTPAVMTQASRADSTHLGLCGVGCCRWGWLVAMEQVNAPMNVIIVMAVNAIAVIGSVGWLVVCPTPSHY